MVKCNIFGYLHIHVQIQWHVQTAAQMWLYAHTHNQVKSCLYVNIAICIFYVTTHQVQQQKIENDVCLILKSKNGWYGFGWPVG